MAGAFAPRSAPTFVVRSVALLARSPVIAGALVERLALPVLIGVGLALRLALLDAYPFREDEAIYSYWSLHLWQVDPLALRVWPDKPPLFLWLLGGTFHLLGPTAVSARLLNVFAATLTIPVVAATARTLWGSTAGLLAALLVALNPFAIAFAPTAYTDPLLVLWGSLAFLTAVRNRPFWAGLFLGAAVMTKQQGVLYVPLVLAVLWMQRGDEAMGGRGDETATATGIGSRFMRSLFRVPHSAFILGFVLVALPVFLWDSLRWRVAPSPWDLSVRTYGGFTVLPVTTWPQRLVEWGDLLWYLTASWWVWTAIAGVGFGLLVARMRRCADARTRGEQHPEGARGGRGQGAGSRGPEALFHTPHTTYHIPLVSHSAFRILHSVLLLWSLLFLAFHVVTSTQVWDRYLLPLAPVMALLMGWAGARGLAALGRNRWRLGAVVVVLIVLWPPASTASRGAIPIGGDHGDYAGWDAAVTWMGENAPAGSILYHRAMGWHARFAFFDADAPGENRYELRWYPGEVYLADNAAKIPHRRKFLILPDWKPLQRAERDLPVRQIALVERFRAGKFTVYELTGPPQKACAWCVCKEDRPTESWLASLTRLPLPATR